MRYITVIGLEIHAELLTKSKIFCSCPNEFGGNVNERVCPVCMGMPGALPVLNKEAVKAAAKAGLILNCKVNNYSSFDRKNYFYPDLPKAYQITQFEFPICTNGYLEIDGKKIRINRIHIEEDAGKLIHENEKSVADYNRCGVPLIEIVTEPDFNSAKEVCQFVEEIALRLKYADVCDAKAEQGSIRVDINISVMPEAASELGKRAEIKNLNSYKSITKAIEYETKRQIEALENGQMVVQETRRYDEKKGVTVGLRDKAEAHDYRYFPEPDLPPILLTDFEIEEFKKEIPQMPSERMKRYTEDYNIPNDDARLLVVDKSFSDFYDMAVFVNPDYKGIAKLMLGAVKRELNKRGNREITITPHNLAMLQKMVKDGDVSKNSANEIIAIMFEKDETPDKIAKDNGMMIKCDLSQLEKIAVRIIEENPKALEEYKNGKEKAFGFFMGQLMRSAGKGTKPEMAKEVMRKLLNR